MRKFLLTATALLTVSGVLGGAVIASTGNAGTVNKTQQVVETKTQQTKPKTKKKQNTKSQPKPSASQETIASTRKYWNVPFSKNFQDYITRLCKQDGVNEKLAYAVMDNESKFNPTLISSTNDYGLFQINVVNRGWLAKKLGITNWFDPYQNAKAGIYMLGMLTKKYHNVNQILLSYNRGEGGMLSLVSRGVWNTDYTLRTFKCLEEIHNV